MTDTDLERRLSASLLRLRGKEPFFAALALFARQQLRDDIGTAATNGRHVMWSREFLTKLSPDEVDGVMLHEVLHAAMLHIPRRGARNPLLWNIAADIWVNGQVDEVAKRVGGFKLPKGAVRDEKLKNLSVEEIYEMLEKSAIKITLSEEWWDLLPPDNGNAGEALEAHWRAAQAQAHTLVRSMNRGDLPEGLLRELAHLEASKLDWRSYLWRYLVRTPTDFIEFDRRMISRGLYIEALDAESVRVFVAVDTSGSIDDRALAQFLGEVQGILRSYPHIICDLFYADADIYGPHRLTAETVTDTLPKPQGGGGTDFRPFFAKVDEMVEGEIGETICVYLTDGYGLFPEPAPRFSTLWVVAAGGLNFDGFPFGEAVRLIANH
jgi:predicted metal-dependent peptidase